jgi:hypothetical protein
LVPDISYSISSELVLKPLSTAVTLYPTKFSVKGSTFCGSQHKERLFPYTALTEGFLGVYAKLQKAIVNFIKSLCLSVRPFVCPSARPHGPTQLPLVGLLFNFYFENMLRKVKFHLRMVRITLTSRENQNTFMIISCSVLPRIRNISDRNCREN